MRSASTTPIQLVAAESEASNNTASHVRPNDASFAT
jgi:hypothetical protein